MTEDFLHFIWQFGLFERNNIKSVTGDKIEIYSLGQLNSDAGPDFFNARVRINETEWAGNIEIHLRSSDWKKHKHHLDSSYNNVILHVVEEPDENIFNEKGALIPTMKLQYDKKLLESYLHLYGSKYSIACKNQILKLDDSILNLFVPALAIERIEAKTNEIREKLIKNGNNWEELFYHTLAKNFGFRVNSLPFEMLAESIPLKVFAKQKNSLLQIESILFGQAGLLPKRSEHPYIKALIAEYTFLRTKYVLSPIPKNIWKYLRVRPVNFPTIRIAQFAALIHQSSALFSRIIEFEKMDSLVKLFSVKASEYWNTHYDFEKPSPNEHKQLGKDSIHSIIINTIVHFVFLYGKEKGRSELTDKALLLLEQIPPENNKIIRIWSDNGIIARNALESQALLQLYNYYCRHKKCLQCEIGTRIIKATKKVL